jgi:hypothetical protein
MEGDVKLSIDEGKWEYVQEGSKQTVYRKGLPFYEYEGDLFIQTMAYEIEHLREELGTVYDKLDKLGIDLDYLDMVDD